MFLEAIDCQPTFISANFHVGLMFHKLGEYLKALQSFNKVLEYAELRNDTRVYMARGDVYKDMGNHLLAIKDYSAAVAIEPNLVTGLFKRGMSKIEIQSFHEAIKDLNDA